MQKYQHTLADTARCSGIGMHSGKEVHLCIRPAPPNHGIRFRRSDLPNSPTVSGIFRNVVDTSLATVLGSEGVIISTIEHLMATFAGLGVDNALVETDSYELPIMDGSARHFTEMILMAGLASQGALRAYFTVNDTIEHRQGDRWVILHPSERFEISCTISFPHPLIKEQTFSLGVTPEEFTALISPARTFGFLHEVDYLKRYGFAKGGSLENAIVVDETSILNEDGLRFPDEFVRHKILDCLGDFSLIGIPILGRIETHKSGHAFNHSFLEKFFSQKDCWRTRTLD
jgi:UDP-3-O-[3-hydroxymyristoyl] N-acetylglucosamine deacetylase